MNKKYFFLIYKLINNYRNIGYKYSNINPIKFNNKNNYKLNNILYNLKKINLNKKFFFKNKYIKLKKILKILNKIYCNNIGINCSFINSIYEKKWIFNKIEKKKIYLNISKKKKIKILKLLIKAKQIEKNINLKYPGQKRFSLEGSESLIILLKEIILISCKLNFKEIIIGMPHRGRLNVLINIFKKNINSLYEEFDNILNNNYISGDVKYHQGFQTNIKNNYGNIKISLAFNPSHLEIINPIIEGYTRSKIEFNNNKNYILPILIHGDASIFGQGVVMETINLSKTRGYKTYGTIHIIVNNQIGFTTSDIRDTKSSLYCSDIAKIIESPIFNINADDPESLIFIIRFIMKYRIKFKKDIFINLICFRKLGHNEQDTPDFTQPLMYKNIKKKNDICDIYFKKLKKKNIISKKKYLFIINKINNNFIKKKKQFNNFDKKYNYYFFKKNKNNYKKNKLISLKLLKIFLKKKNQIPIFFKIHDLIKKNIINKINIKENNIDWGTSEYILYSYLLYKKYSIRLSGQDVSRGTFSHRHIIIHNQNKNIWDKGTYNFLSNFNKKNINNNIINSILSEEAILGFEYGFSITNYKTLIIWEAQFGDFSNGAQVIIDQFICSGEEKWNQTSNLVILLPHGYEGQGPEHSSARLERYLQLCANNNIKINQPTNTSQFFHLIKNHMLNFIRKPLIIFTPKSLLRNKLSYSNLLNIHNNNYKKIILKNKKYINKKNKNIIMCSGKIYYDLIINKNINNKFIFLILEQLYPFPHKEFSNILKKIKKIKKIIWIQDEPKNQGAWEYIKNYINNYIKNNKIIYIGRKYSSSTAMGNFSKHIEQQNKIFNDILYFK